MAIDKFSAIVANFANAANASSSKKTDVDLPTQDARDPKMLEAARSFENQFIRQMISEMRKTVPQDELLGNSMADDIFREQLDDKYADQWVDQGGIGLADMIYNQLYEKYGPTRYERAPTTTRESATGSSFLHVAPSRLRFEARPQARKNPGGHIADNRPRDILSQADKSLFLMKMSQNGFTMKSQERAA